IKNISIIGSAQVGKTSLGDAILLNLGKTTRLGKPSEGTSLLDTDADEIQRKITISSSLFSVEVNNNKLNFLDTPGYPAFTSQVITSVNICETALLVLCAVSGVDVFTRKNWRLTKQLSKSKSIFINRMDRDQANFEKTLSALKNMSNKVCPFTIPIGSGEKFTGVVDIIKQKAYIQKDGKTEEQDIPAELKAAAEKYREELTEAAAENNEELLEKFLESGTLSGEDLFKGIKIGMATNDIMPLFVGSADKNIGVTELVDILSNFAPAPLEKSNTIKVINSNNEEEEKEINGGTSFLQVFKLEDENKTGEMAFLKVFGQKVASGNELTNFQSKQKERLGHIYIIAGKSKDEVSALYPGDIAGIPKLKSVSIGHTLYSNKESIQVKPFIFPDPIIAQAIKTASEKDREKLGEGLQSLHRLDPCFRSEHRPEFDEIICSGLSKLHLEIMMNKIKAKYNIEYTFEKPQIPYRETVQGSAKAQGKYKKQTGGHGQYGDCWLEVSSKPVGTGYNFVNKISGGVIPSKYIPAVEKGVVDAMSKGVLAGFPLVDVEVKLYDGSYHSVDSSDLAFKMAGTISLKKAAEQANPILLEPILKVEVIIPEQYVGDVSADFNQRRGKISGMDGMEDGYKMIRALVPMAEMYQYSIDLKSMTKGDGTFSTTFEKYEAVPTHISQKIISTVTKEE
ncbi:elongation factor G, partial [Candidatus Margulisiibacteriota bacterium]